MTIKLLHNLKRKKNMKNEKIKSVFIADTTLVVSNTVRPVSTTNTTSKVFKTYSDVVKHKSGLYDATHNWNNDTSSNTPIYYDEIQSVITHNKINRQFTIDSQIADPKVAFREVNISDLTAEQRNEFESLYNMKIVEETFPNKVVEFKTASKVEAVETDTSVEAVSRDENVSVNQ